MKYRIRNTGFTLVELIIVVIVIGILAAVGMPQYSKAIERAKGVEAEAGLANIAQGEKIYFAEQETYLVIGNTIGDMDASTGIGAISQQALDINLPQKNFLFYTTSAGSTTYAGVTYHTAFRITAVRKSGACAGRIITVDEKGNKNTDDWMKSCAEAL